MTKLQEILFTSRPLTYIRKKSKTLVLPGFEGIPLYPVYKFFITHSRHISFVERASAMSFNFIMALPAAAIFLFTLIPYFPVAKNIQDELFVIITDLTPNNETRTLILTTMFDLFNKPKTGLLSLGFLLALFYSSNAMVRMIRTFDRSLQIKKKPNFIKLRLRALKLTLILIVVLIVTLFLSIGQGFLFAKIMEWMSIDVTENSLLVQLLRWVIIILLFLYSIAFIYKYAPSVDKRWHLFSPGAVLATVLIMLATFLFSVWAQNFSNYNKIYGSIGALLFFMLLVYINSFMLLIGYELNVGINHLKHLRDIKNGIPNSENMKVEKIN